jgi:hypothetical protein
VLDPEQYDVEEPKTAMRTWLQTLVENSITSPKERIIFFINFG